MALYRHEAKTRNRYHLGASFEGLIIWIKKELEAPRPKNRFLVKFGFSVKIHLYHPKGGLLCLLGESSGRPLDSSKGGRQEVALGLPNSN